VKIDIRQATPALSASGFGGAWFALCLAFSVDIGGEWSTGLPPVYDPAVVLLRKQWGWFSTSSFEFRDGLEWLVLACGILFVFTPVAARGMRGLRPVAWSFAILMFLNALGQTLFFILGGSVAAVRFQHPGAGFYSSQFLFVTSLWLMYRLRRTARVDFQLPSGV